MKFSSYEYMKVMNRKRYQTLPVDQDMKCNFSEFFGYSENIVFCFAATNILLSISFSIQHMMHNYICLYLYA